MEYSWQPIRDRSSGLADVRGDRVIRKVFKNICIGFDISVFETDARL